MLDRPSEKVCAASSGKRGCVAMAWHVHTMLHLIVVQHGNVHVLELDEDAELVKLHLTAVRNKDTPGR